MTWIARMVILALLVLAVCMVTAINNIHAASLIEPFPETISGTANTMVIAINDDISIETVSTEAVETETVSEPEAVEGGAAADASNTTSYTEEDLYYLTHVLTGECHTAPWDEQIAVGSVVLNRVADPEFPDTIKGVIEDRHYGIQYACFYDGNFKREATQTNIEVAKYLLENGSQLPSDVIYQSQHRQGSGTYVKINKHYFCYK